MMRKVLVPLAVVVVLAVGVATPVGAQSLTIHLGGFVPTAEDARADGDVLFENLNYLWFDLKEFNGFTIGGDYLFPVGRNLEAGVGLGLYQRTVPSVYRDLVNDNGAEIAQRLKLRIVPVTFTARFLPMGSRAAFQPYLGVGIGVLAWRYSETGEFVDYSTYDIFRATYSASGATAGPVVLGGIRVPVGRRTAIGGEIRYQGATADIGTDFYSDRLDLGGMTYSFTMTFRY